MRSTPRCGNATCRDIGYNLIGRKVGESCDDTSGNDAVVMCRDTGCVSRLVKVECKGDCNRVTIAQICSPYGLLPGSVSCDDPATPGQVSDNWFRTCGETSSARCRWDRGGISGTDKLETYCGDSGGYDAIAGCFGNQIIGGNPTYVPVSIECNGNCDRVLACDLCPNNNQGRSNSAAPKRPRLDVVCSRHVEAVKCAPSMAISPPTIL